MCDAINALAVVRLALAGAVTTLGACGRAAEPGAAGGALDRTVLPIAEPTYRPITELDARAAKAPPRFEIKAPAGAPNVVIVLIDDIGFGHSSAFGGPINMPTLDRLAGEGLRYNRFHTTALCSPTRTALLTGRNHHVNNAGAIMELATAFPGNTGVRPNSVYSADEGVDVGADNETPVAEEYREGDNAFTGRILKVTVETQPPQRA